MKLQRMFSIQSGQPDQGGSLSRELKAKAGAGAAKVVNKAESAASGAKKTLSGGGRKFYTKSIETAANAGQTLVNTARRAKLDAKEAVSAGRSAAMAKNVQRNAAARKQLADQASKLAAQYERRSGSAGANNAMSIVNKWLSGQNIAGSSPIQGYKTEKNLNSLAYLENLIQASGYVKKK